MKTVEKSNILWRAVIGGIGALIASVPCSAQGVTIGSSLLPQLAFGGGWYSALYFTNLNSSNVSFAVSFVSDTGTALTVPSVGGSSTQVSIAAHGTAIIEAPNMGNLVEGYATFTLPSGVIGYGIFRQSVPGRADQEAVVPFSGSSSTTTTLTFDETAFTSGVAIVNPSSTAATVAVTAWDSNGNTIGSSSINLPPYNKTEGALSTLAGLSGVTGQRGAAQFNVSAGAVAVLGLRFSGAAFTSIPTNAPTASMAPLVSSFKAGKYLGPASILNGKAIATVAGPGVSDNGATEWSWAAAPGADACTVPSSGSWYVGPLANSPWAGRLAAAKITSAAYSYGIAASERCTIAGVNSDAWRTGTLIGVSQVGNAITIVSFSNGGGDHSTPVDQVTYTLGTPATFPAQPASSFQAGQYVAASSILAGKALVTVNGPGASDNGTTEWALSTASSADNCTFPSSATWYAGPIANGPYAMRIQNAGITSTALSYGVGGGPRCTISGVNSDAWRPDTLIGVSQAGNAITIISFSDGAGDHSTPIDQVTYTLTQ